jgi:hypothetical protein
MNKDYIEIDKIIKNLVCNSLEDDENSLRTEQEITILKSAIISLMGMKLGFWNNDMIDKRRWQVNESIENLIKWNNCSDMKGLIKLKKFIEENL